MKKKLLIILLFIVFSGITNAQPYHRFLENNSWYEYVFGFTGGNYYWYYKSNDTIINSTTFTIIRVSTGGEYYIREDSANKKVYVNDLFNPEYLLYDFSLLPGGLFVYQGATFVLDSIVPVPTLLGNRDKFYFHNIANSSFRASCIEGIGSQEDPMSFKVLISDPVWVLVCSYVGNAQYYWNGVDSCAVNIYTQIIENKILKEPMIFPAISNGEFTVRFSANMVETPLVIYNSIGKKIHEEVISGTLEKRIDLKSISAGIYFVKIKTSAGYRSQKLIVQH